MTKAMRRVSDASPPSLPEEMVAEILSWVPVESLLRFKCVCKKWRQLIQQDDDFVEMHHRRAAMDCYYQKNYINQLCSEFSCIDIQEGLLLEQEHRKDPTGRLRIRNPATMQTVHLPDLRAGDEPPPWAVARMFFVAKECTVISFSESEESVFWGQFKALTVGVDESWRSLKNSPQNFTQCISNSGRKPKIFALSIQKIFHVVTMDGPDRNILSVDSEDESVKTVKIPENIFNQWWGVMPGEWDSKLSLFRHDGNQIKICVLNNNQWANFKIETVHLATLTQNYPISYMTKEEKTWMRRFNGIQRDINWGRHKSIYVPWLMKEELSIKPSLLRLKGMQSQKC